MIKHLIPNVFWYKSEYSAFGTGNSAAANQRGILNGILVEDRYNSSTAGSGSGYGRGPGDGFGIPHFRAPLLLGDA